jgi:hypothetical protein
MPISLNNPITIIVDKVRIDQFSVSPQRKSVTIHFSKGHEDASGNFVPHEYDRVDLENLDFDPTLYNQVKDYLYQLLSARLNPQSQDQ